MREKCLKTQTGPQSNGQNAIIVRFVESFRKKSCEVKYFEVGFKICLIFQASSVFESSFVRILSVWIFPVLIFLFYWYLNLCLAREFTLRSRMEYSCFDLVPVFAL